MAVIALKVFDPHSVAGVEACRPLLEMGAGLGGKAALAIHHSNADRQVAADILTRFAEAAAGFGPATNLEAVAGGKGQTLAQAIDAVRSSGADVRICSDPPLPMRADVSVASVPALEPGLIRHVQLCDGPIRQPAEIAKKRGCVRAPVGRDRLRMGWESYSEKPTEP